MHLILTYFLINININIKSILGKKIIYFTNCFKYENYFFYSLSLKWLTLETETYLSSEFIFDIIFLFQL